jgi:hypothetical protein
VATITQYKFLGSWIAFTILCLTIVGIPVALLYLLNSLVSVSEEVDDPVEAVETHRSKW